MATAFELVEHLVTVPVLLDGAETRFVLDSGIGLTLVRGGGYELLGRSFTGRRMSGQDVRVELAAVPSLAFDGLRRDDVEVGVLDLFDFPPALDPIGGFLSLAFFDDVPFTVDYAAGTVAVEPAEAGPRGGVTVPVTVERDGPSVTVFMALELPGGGTISAEVDMGSDALILDERFAPEVGVDLADPRWRRVEGVDETGHPYVRTFARIEGEVGPPQAPGLAQARPEVMFQRIVHDGLVGHAFLRRFAVTWELSRGRLLFGHAG